MAPRTKSSARTDSKLSVRSSTQLTWAAETELLGLTFELEALSNAALPAQYTVGLHAWFLDQVRQRDTELSTYLHDGESEKPFTLSGLERSIIPSRMLQLRAGQTYRWTVTALSQPVVRWLQQWLQVLPTNVGLHQAPLQIRQVTASLAPTTYKQLLSSEYVKSSPIALSFSTPTSFRRKGHHLPLPLPRNVFHSYLRRWNDFSAHPVEQEPFLDWIDDSVIIQRHRLESVKVAAGKRGAVTGFTGAVEFGLSSKARHNAEFVQLFYALVHLAPYCGTGHKTPFGLGQTRLGWLASEEVTLPLMQVLLAQRITELTELFMAQRQRTGGERTQKIAETWATILARRELGESLQDIAQDLEIKYETVKTYAKLARRAIKLPVSEQ